ncbi:unnamed protein product [Urochloa decumbens]|uniref:Dirigent protein n=1 Tax=Urochloa decumbens TaxID=240449 RepID=A0ABC9E7E1_9POAL
MANQLFQAASLQHGFRQDQLYLVLYLEQEYCRPKKNRKEVKPNSDNEFGVTVVSDWPLYDGLELKAKKVACVRGHQTGKDKHGSCFLSCNIIFLDDSCYPGSTLVVTGMMEQGNHKGEWAIVGGTGKFNLAQGAIYYDAVEDNNQLPSVIKELHIGVVFTPMERSSLRLMFCEFNPSEVEDAINDAIKNRMDLGRGGYGSVYKAKLRKITVAVKIKNDASWQGKREFNQEVEILKKTRHENLVTLVGACSKKLALVYEFLPNGTLQDRLKQDSFSWEERVRVAIGICSGLEFLHNAKPDPIAHGDLKPSNILFDAEDVCKLGDFGISRLLKYTEDTGTPSHTTGLPKGSASYIDPEFERTRRLTPPSDVYALGIILLQLVTGRGATRLREDVASDMEKFGDRKKDTTQTKKICKLLVDPKLQRQKLDEKSELNVVKMIRLGLKCSNGTRKERPDLETEVRPEIESMRSCASVHEERPPPIDQGVGGTSLQESEFFDPYGINGSL